MLEAVKVPTTDYVDLGVLTDEEIQIIEDADSSDDNDFDYPRLSSQGEAIRDAAVDAVAYVLLARAEVAFSDDGVAVPQGRHAFIAEHRRIPKAIARIDVSDDREDVLLRAALYPAMEGVVIVEEVDDVGFHRFRLMSLERGAEWILDGFAGQSLTGDVRDMEMRIKKSGLKSLRDLVERSGFFVVSRAPSKQAERTDRAWSIFVANDVLVAAEGLATNSKENVLVEVHGEQSAKEWSRLLIRTLFEHVAD